jgi:hypothetical protein
MNRPRFSSCAASRILPVVMSAMLPMAVAVSARGHFVFVVPDDAGGHGRVILSEDLEVDDDVDAALVDRLALVTRDGSGHEAAVTLEVVAGRRRVRLPADDGVVHGTLVHGVMSRGGAAGFLIVYHPKTVIGLPFGSAVRIGDEAPAELVPSGSPTELRLQLLARGRPVADASVNMILPDGSRQVVSTDAHGRTPAFTAAGRYGAWARVAEATPGEHDGQPYAEIRRYPTLVADLAGPDGRAVSPASSRRPMQRPLTTTEKLPPLPEAASSLGAVACDGMLYAYGGHVAPVHTYSTVAVSGRFSRLRLGDVARGWEPLPAGPGMQGMNLATHRGRIYRVGGMVPQNAPGTPAVNHSTTAAACFDPATGRWHDLPPLPEPRSSHDLAVVGDTLYVVGGWNMLGADGEDWAGTMLALDLTAAESGWRSLPQPFERRALIAAVADGRLHVMGGFTPEEDASLRLDIFDPADGVWTRGPDLPGGSMNGFAPAACTVAGRIHVSVADGRVLRLSERGDAWEEVARVTPRIVHRAVPDGDEHLVLVGGAAAADNLDLVERVRVR